MNRESSVGYYVNGPASRRMHRRLAAPLLATRTHAELKRAFAPHLLGDASHSIFLPPTVTRGAAALELVAAKRRIAELEEALASARNVASTDPLTGVLNRRGLEEAFQREMAKARRNGANAALMSLVLIDMDDFKRLNDVHGHQVGDRALVHLVNVLRAAMRPSDVLARFGGEEFVLLLPDSTLTAAVAAVERFQRELAEQMMAGNSIRLTFSAGVVQCEADAALGDSIRRADTATYAAKRAGKNCVVAG